MEKNFAGLSSTEEKLLNYSTFAERILDGVALFGLNAIVGGAAISNLKEFGVLSIIDYAQKRFAHVPSASGTAGATSASDSTTPQATNQQGTSQAQPTQPGQPQAQNQNNQTATNVIASNLFGKVIGWFIASWLVVKSALFVLRRYFELRTITDQATTEEDN